MIARCGSCRNVHMVLELLEVSLLGLDLGLESLLYELLALCRIDHIRKTYELLLLVLADIEVLGGLLTLGEGVTSPSQYSARSVNLRVDLPSGLTTGTREAGASGTFAGVAADGGKGHDGADSPGENGAGEHVCGCFFED